MKSVVVHYQEIALKGRNRPWFVARLVRNLRSALADLDVKQVRALMGRIEIVLGPGADWTAIGERLGARLRHRELRARRSNGARRRRHRRRYPARSRGSADRDLPRVGAPGRQAVSARPHRRSSARSEAGSRKPGAGRSTSGIPQLTIHVEALTNEAFYFFGKERGAGGLPDRRERTRSLPAVGRHRLTGCRLAHDEARVPRHASSTSTAIRFCRAPRKTRRVSSRSCWRPISSDRGCCSCRSAKFSSRSFSRSRRPSASSSIAA